ncbi:hypothetical protein ABZP36_014211 [Zizania latifolia]
MKEREQRSASLTGSDNYKRSPSVASNQASAFRGHPRRRRERRHETYKGMDGVTRLASQRAVVVFSRSSCGMCHAVTRQLRELGVDETALAVMLPAVAVGVVPAVFIGGRLVVSTDRVMSLHLAGNLVPLLRDAGTLWV